MLGDGSNPNITLWQSFDHPMNTWLPCGKLALNKVTGELQRLVSWKNQDDPAPGIFSLEIDPNGTSQYFMLWGNSYKYCSSGMWNGQIFSLVPEMTGKSSSCYGWRGANSGSCFGLCRKHIAKFMLSAGHLAAAMRMPLQSAAASKGSERSNHPTGI